MQIPANISKEHIIKAIELIENEGIPKYSQSDFYDLVYNNKEYPPKVVVSFANKFANGIELNRDSFDGGLNTPCFRLLEKHGFLIKPKSPAKKIVQVIVHEIKAEPNSQENFEKLHSRNGEYFFWDDKIYKNINVGDFIFIINKDGGRAYFAKLGEKNIATSHDLSLKRTRFEYGHDSFEIDDELNRFNVFVRLDIIENIDIGRSWTWVIPIGQAESYYLWKHKIDDVDKRLSRLNDLKKIFSRGEAYEKLTEIERLLGKSHNIMIPEIIEAIQSKEIKDALNENNFLFKRAQTALYNLDQYSEPVPNFFSTVLSSFLSSKKSYKVYVSELVADSEEFKFLKIVSTVVAYCDSNAAFKTELNEYPDKRTLANSFVRQPSWVENLINYKINKNDLSFLSPSIYNAISYIKNPYSGMTMLSESHREMCALNLLKKEVYNKEEFVDSVIDFFKPYQIAPLNNENLTEIISSVLYRYPKVKKLWFDKVEGLVVQDSTDWMDDAINDLNDSGKIVLWWSKVPSARGEVDKLLETQIENAGSFYLYYLQQNNVRYRARVIDYSYETNYNKKQWNENNDVAWFNKSFSEYKGGNKKAAIAFLVDEFIEINSIISVDDFKYYTGHAPRQDNLQPYIELNLTSEPTSANIWFVTQGKTYSENVGKSYLWAPTESNGQKKFYWDNVSRVRKGDIIFNYSDGLRGVSIAKTDGYKAKNDDERWPNEGYRVDIDLTELHYKIPVSEFRSHKAMLSRYLQDITNKPFQADGSANQGYLYEFTKEAGRYIRDVIYQQKFDNILIDNLLDCANIDNMPIMSELTFEHKYRREICAIRTKPFLLMAGISGTGKSRLVRTLAYKTCPEELYDGNSPGNFLNLSVKPNWHDSTELIGYESRIPTRHYVVTDFIRFVIKAWENLGTPFFLCLDEMNLAPVEQYFAEYLSKIESRRKSNGLICTDSIISSNYFKLHSSDFNITDVSLHDKFLKEGISLPANLIIIGTVNMDETTHSFSRKVIDRGMTFERNLKNENGEFQLTDQLDNDWTFNDPMQSDWFLSKEIKPAEILDFFNEKNEVVDRLNIINRILNNTAFMIAYRTLDEAMLYMYFNSLCINKPANWFDCAFDDVILMKILPRIEGDELKTSKVLIDLKNLLVTHDKFIGLKRTRIKCETMLEKLESGYTSFWN